VFVIFMGSLLGEVRLRSIALASQIKSESVAVLSITAGESGPPAWSFSRNHLDTCSDIALEWQKIQRGNTGTDR
jgi:hypothetical protein